MKLALLGASGRVGLHIIEESLELGYELRGQTRAPSRLAEVADKIQVWVFDPRDPQSLAEFIEGCDAVILALGIKSRTPTTLFSDVTRSLLPAMSEAGIKRLIAITGIGAGETRGHGGFLYDRIIFPLFTRNRYRDKELQETLIEQSDLEWTIVRPAPFARKSPGSGLSVITEIESDTCLRRVTPREVARFIVGQIDDPGFLREKPFIGHP